MIAEYTETVFNGNTDLDIPPQILCVENAPMGNLERLTARRKECGFTQETLADRMGIAQPTIQRWESGKREPNIDQLIELAKILDVSIDWLVGLNSEIENVYTPVIRRILNMDGVPDDHASLLADTVREAVRLLLAFPDDEPVDRPRLAAQAAWQAKSAPRPN